VPGPSAGDGDRGACADQGVPLLGPQAGRRRAAAPGPAAPRRNPAHRRPGSPWSRSTAGGRRSAAATTRPRGGCVRATYITRENLRSAITAVVNATLEARDPQWLGEATSTASDSKRFASWETPT